MVSVLDALVDWLSPVHRKCVAVRDLST